MSKFFSLFIVAFFLGMPLYFTYHSDTGSKSREPAQAPYHSATVEEMENPKCLNQDHVRRNDVNVFIKKYSDLSTVKVTPVSVISGIRFENENPELLYRFTQLVTPRQDLPDSNRGLNPATIRQAFGNPQGCAKVLCAVQRIFGQEEGPLILLLLTEYDLNLSHYVWKDADPWQIAEIHDILKTIEAVPSQLLPLDLNKKLIHFKRGVADQGNNDVIANSTIIHFDTWSKQISPVRQYCTYHEFSHNWAALHSHYIDVSPEWLKISGWSTQETLSDAQSPYTHRNWDRHPGTKQVSIYARENPFEDFAETVSAYRYAPQRLKTISLAKYTFVKDIIYNGMEFTEPCKPPNDLVTRYEKDFVAYDQSADPSFIQKMAEKCFKQNIGLLKDLTAKSGFLSCLSLNAAASVLQSKGQFHGETNKPMGLYDSLGGVRVRFQSIERQGSQNLENLVLAVLKPHLASLQKGLDSKSCGHAFASQAIAEQASSLGMKNTELYFAIEGLSAKICQEFIASGIHTVSEDSVKEKLKPYF